MDFLIKNLCFHVSSASGRLPPGAALPVHRLAGVQRHASLQTLHPAAGAEVGEMAGAVRRWGREDRGSLPVSSQTHPHVHELPTCHKAVEEEVTPERRMDHTYLR